MVEKMSIANVNMTVKMNLTVIPHVKGTKKILLQCGQFYFFVQVTALSIYVET